ncbi:alpha/beta fold hydrolase [Nocardia sp. NPDC050718]|uniref:alpha/beta hydrolase n=1 Tax=Nocardia sp. NPDC050718 TaxID=3155788 RepID=UPI0033C136B8
MPDLEEIRLARRPSPQPRPTFVLVHGAHGNAAAWSALLRELALLGHRALAVDLPGHGLDAHFPLAYQAPQDLDALTARPSPLASITLEDNVTHVIDTVRKVHAHGPVVLVGTSGGGATISGVGNAVPELLTGIVYLSAWCCVELPRVSPRRWSTGALPMPPSWPR